MIAADTNISIRYAFDCSLLFPLAAFVLFLWLLRKCE
jgi:hypothetical protein